jgi:diguanylate cyclase
VIARWYFSSYSLARRVTLTTVATLVVMLTLAGLTLAAVFAKAQIDQSRVAALTQASVASSTVSAAMRFGGAEVIAETLRVFDGGSDPDSAAVYDRQGRLVSEFVAYGEERFPPELSGLATQSIGVLQAKPIQLVLGDDPSGSASPILGTLVVNPNQRALSGMFSRALVILALVLAISAIAGTWVAKVLSRAMLRPVADLTAWAEAVAKTRNLQAPAPRGRGQEVGRLTSSFESLIAQLAEQNRELKRKQYELKAHNDQLETMAFSDSLTGLPNRAMFEATLHGEIAAARASGKRLTVLFADLDNLKVINDTYGHAHGDDALRATAARMRRALRSTDFLARLSGDEFVIVSSNIATAADAVKLGERLTVWLGISLPEDQWIHPIRVSIGVTVFPDDGDDITSLMHAADIAMYRAKALPADDSIRVVRAGDPLRGGSVRAGNGSGGTSNVIALPTQHRKTHTGSS